MPLHWHHHGFTPQWSGAVPLKALAHWHGTHYRVSSHCHFPRGWRTDLQEDRSGPWRLAGEHLAPGTAGAGPECSSRSHHLSGGVLTREVTAAVATGRMKGPYRYVGCICCKYRTQEESSKDGSNMVTHVQMWVSARGWVLVLPVLWSKSGPPSRQHIKNAPLAVGVAPR